MGIPRDYIAAVPHIAWSLVAIASYTLATVLKGEMGIKYTLRI